MLCNRVWNDGWTDANTESSDTNIASVSIWSIVQWNNVARRQTDGGHVEFWLTAKVLGSGLKKKERGREKKNLSIFKRLVLKVLNGSCVTRMESRRQVAAPLGVKRKWNVTNRYMLRPARLLHRSRCRCRSSNLTQRHIFNVIKV